MSYLRKLRKKSGLTQMDVEVMTGIDTSTLSLYENDIHSPTVKNAKKLGALYGVEWSDFYGDDENDERRVQSETSEPD